jgi:hypothetical protein
LVIRPPRPEPCTLPGSTARSAIIFRAAGSAVVVVVPVAAMAGAAAAFAAAGGRCRRAGAVLRCSRSRHRSRRRCRGPGVAVDDRNHLLTGDRRTIALPNLDEHARLRRGKLQDDFVGLDVD